MIFNKDEEKELIINKNVEENANQMIKYAYLKSEFYHEKYRNCKQLKYSEIPNLMPDEIAKNSEVMRTSMKIFRTSVSSGTTGTPKVLFRTIDDFDKSIDNQIKLMQWCNVDENDIVGIVQPFGLCAYGDLTLGACKKMGVMAVPIGCIDNKFVIEYIKDFHITVLDISPSKLSDLIDIVEKNHEDIKIKKAMLAGETLELNLIKRAQRVLGCKVYSQYGTEELDGLAGACNSGTEMKILDDSFLFELTEERKISEGIYLGNLVITSLYHKGTPIIKYSTGDICEFNKNNNHIKVLGRGIEFYNIYDSVMLYPFQIESFFLKNGYCITFWECELISHNSYNSLIIKIKDTQCDNLNFNKITKEFSMINSEINCLINEGKLNVIFKPVSVLSDETNKKHTRFKINKKHLMLGEDDDEYRHI